MYSDLIKWFASSAALALPQTEIYSPKFWKSTTILNYYSEDFDDSMDVDREVIDVDSIESDTELLTSTMSNMNLSEHDRRDSGIYLCSNDRKLKDTSKNINN